jgi:hypothetical protein
VVVVRAEGGREGADGREARRDLMDRVEEFAVWEEGERLTIAYIEGGR